MTSFGPPVFLGKALEASEQNSINVEQCRRDVPFLASNQYQQIGVQCGTGKILVDREKEFVTVAVDQQGTGTETKTIPAMIFAEAVVWDANHGDPPRQFKLLLDPLSLWWGDTKGQPLTRSWSETGGGLQCSTNEDALLLNPSL